ncbi:hypothetical protein GCM10010170_016840 [Dactylosporangium salmoneum]|uniref:Uncharacterized protein n=2 Tax=Dactylosporangium salmoneum TaxID=53361 RepID=A0ABN3FSE0_9ACTN
MAAVTALALAAGLLGGLADPGPAAAKGALSVTIEGPGLAVPVRLEQADGEAGRRLNDLATAAKVDWFGLGNRIEAGPAPADRGPAYDSVWEPGGLRLLLHPFAVGGPLVVLPPGQRRLDDGTALTAGWMRVPAALTSQLTALGVRPPGFLGDFVARVCAAARDVLGVSAGSA